MQRFYYPRLMLSISLAAICFFILGVQWGLLGQPPFAFAEPLEKQVTDHLSSGENGKSEENVVTLAGGCFWCVEAVYERMEGVSDVVSGYTGDPTAPNPTYVQVSAGSTKHAEACQVFYDPSKTNFKEILDVFFRVHDPTTLNRQGNDVGPQYRSAIFYHNESQKKAAQQYIEKLEKAREFSRPIVTTVEELDTFYPAEEYHQDYFRRNPTAGYCRTVVRRKVQKFQDIFADKVRKDEVANQNKD